MNDSFDNKNFTIEMETQYRRNTRYWLFSLQLFFGVISCYYNWYGESKIILMLVVANIVTHVIVCALSLRFTDKKEITGLFHAASVYCTGIMFINFGITIAQTSLTIIIYIYILYDLLICANYYYLKRFMKHAKQYKYKSWSILLAVAAYAISGLIFRYIIIKLDRETVNSILFYLSIVLAAIFSTPVAKGALDYTLKRGINTL